MRDAGVTRSIVGRRVKKGAPDPKPPKKQPSERYKAANAMLALQDAQWRENERRR
jgi:hypothetical protein